jgi:hypothetical protein
MVTPALAFVADYTIAGGRKKNTILPHISDKP